MQLKLSWKIGWHKLVPLVTSSFIYGGGYHVAGIHVCSPEMTLIWLETPEWLKSAVVEYSRPKAVLTYIRVRCRAN